MAAEPTWTGLPRQPGGPSTPRHGPSTMIFASAAFGNCRRRSKPSAWKEGIGVVAAICPWNFPFEVIEDEQGRPDPRHRQHGRAQADSGHAVDRHPSRPAGRRAHRHSAWRGQHRTDDRQRRGGTAGARPLWGAETALMASELQFSGSDDNLYATRSYSWISPPGTLRRRIRAVAKSIGPTSIKSKSIGSRYVESTLNDRTLGRWDVQLEFTGRAADLALAALRPQGRMRYFAFVAAFRPLCRRHGYGAPPGRWRISIACCRSSLRDPV